METVCLAMVLFILWKICCSKYSAARLTCPQPDAPLIDEHACKWSDKIDCISVGALNKAVWVHYNGADGMDDLESDRLIVIHEISGVMTSQGFEVRLMEAYCRKAHISRTFLAARVAHASDAETGESIVDFPKWLAALSIIRQPAHG